RSLTQLRRQVTVTHACGNPGEWGRDSLRQLADPQMAELDRCALGFQTEVAGAGLAAAAAGDLLAVDPQPDLAIDAPHVIMVPVAKAQAQILQGEAAAAVGRRGREGRHP